LSQIFIDAYQRFFAALTADPAIVPALVSANNVRPSDDVVQAEPGNLIHYSWLSSAFEQRANRARGLLLLTVEASESKLVAQTIVGLVRSALTARKITGAVAGGQQLRMHLFKEELVTNDQGVTAAGRWRASMQFQALFVKGTA
jgi:hypothetical protein